MPLAEMFLHEWGSRLTAARQGKPAVHCQEAELWEGVREAIQIAKLGRYLPEGLEIERIIPQALKKVASDDRPSAQLDLLAGAKRYIVVVAVSKKDGGVAFGAWYDALEAATTQVAGAVAIWPKAQLTVGKTAKAHVKYRKRIDDGLLRAFPLDENEDTFRQLETLRVLLKDAESSNLTLAGKNIGADECRKLLLETRVLVNLKLFEMLFCNWPAIDKTLTRPTASLPAPPTVLPVAAPLPAAMAVPGPTVAVAVPAAPAVQVASAAAPGATSGAGHARPAGYTAEEQRPAGAASWVRSRADVRPAQGRTEGRY